jgi:uncharacterized OB-fold protein
MSKTRVAAVDGWFTMDAERPHLLGSRCTRCNGYFFPRESLYCRNPACSGTEFEEVPLSRTGRLWSYTNSCYEPPAPYVAPDPFVPYAIGAVELVEERMVVLGQMASGVDVDDLKVGMEVELVLETLFEDDEAEHVVWKWRPVTD